MTPTRAVLDTNVAVSALLFRRGAVAWMRAAWRSGNIVPMASRETMAELIRVLAYPKFELSESEQRDLLDDYLPFCESAVVPEPPPVTPLCRDPCDRPFLELALAGRADALVTGDADMLALAEIFAAPILSPAALRDRLKLEARAPG